MARPDGTLEIYSKQGELTDTIRLAEYVSSCVFDQNLWALSKTGLDAVRGADTGIHVALPDLPWYAHEFPLGLAHQRLGLLESSEEILYVLNPREGTWLRNPLDAPEFQEVRDTPMQEKGTLPFFTSPSVAGEALFVLANPFSVKQGAKVLRFDVQGNLVARYLCPLPTSVVPPTGKDPKGYFTPTSLVVADRTLLLISSPQKLVIVYSLN